ncbi:MAG: DUF465 domain-containing protein [Alphaproteobacteria bacterium]|jgi:hypothetical protein|nr:DUF465 domain-containing protein [Alphaproteobacteria bacterium]MBP9776382.1 DUF465 domain-containing protein [Alphaproteobacteria bacterium]
MAVSRYLASLKRKYAYLNTLIQDELSRPLPDSILLFDLKIKRLHLKEKIYSLV